VRGLRTIALAVALAIVAGAATALPGAAQEQRPRFDTRLLARVPTPGFPALAYVHPNGRIYAGTYVNPDAAGVPSRVFEYTGEGRLLRSFTVPGQDTSAGEQGVQVATSDAAGDLVLLDQKPARALKLDRKTGNFTPYSTFADLAPCAPGEAANTCSPTAADEPARPNFGAWGRDGSLYVTDFLQGVIWRVPPGGGGAQVWLSDRRLDGGMFGTTGIALAADGTTLLVAQGSSGGSAALTSPNATTGKIYSVPIGADGAPGELRQIYESRPGDLPDGFAIAASGRIYVPLVGLPQQIAVLAPDGTEIERFPEAPGSGANGSEVPFDSPSSARFLGTRLIVANQSAVAGDPNNQAILDVEAGETGLPEMIPGLDQVAPEVRRVAVSNRRFATAPRNGRPSRRPARGTILRLGLTEPATVDIRVARRTGPGHWQQRDVIERTLPRGRHGIVFRGRVRRGERLRALTPGRFRFSIRATDPSGNRSTSTHRSGREFREFTIVRERPSRGVRERRRR
jgi:sugar lactone lactonase YvrE